jgi:hypothetical protein
MNKFIIEESEVKRILSMHKALIKEQSPTTAADVSKSIKDQLTVFTTNGCVKNGKVVPMKTTNPQKQFAIRQENKIIPGKVRYLFIDNTVGISDETGKFKFLPNKWACDTGAIQNKSSAEQAAATAANNLSDALLKEKKENEGWMEYSELKDKGYSQLEAEQGKYATEQFKLKNGKVITLYKPKTGAVMGAQQAGMTDEQREFIKKYELKNGKLKLTPAEQASQEYRQIEVPGSREVTGWENTGLRMWFNLEDIRNISGSASELKTTIENQQIEREECKDFVDEFFRGYEQDTDIPDFEIVKRKVQRCKSLYSPNPRTGRKSRWGIFSNQKNKIDILSGLESGKGPSKAGQDAKWRLN